MNVAVSADARDGSDATAVILTRTEWTEIPRLRHQIARALAKTRRVLFVETPTSWSRWYATSVEQVEPNIVRCRLGNRGNLPRRVQWHVPGVNRVLQRLHLRRLETCLDELGWVDRPVLVNFNYNAGPIMQSERFRARIYVCNDDWPAKAPGKASRRAVERQEAIVAKSADVCLAVSYPLVDALKKHNSRTRLFLPGHDFPPARGSFHRGDAGDPLKVVFMGNVNRRVATQWLVTAAAQDDLDVHCIGTRELDPTSEAELVTAGVHFHPPRFGADLQRFLEQADVLVVPYLLHEDVIAVTASNKLFSYLAAERPVVISDMPNFLDLGEGIIYRAHDADDFVRTIRHAASADNAELRRRRRDIAAEHHWSRRGRELEEVIRGCANREASTG